jgi:hypothetical protein
LFCKLGSDVSLDPINSPPVSTQITYNNFEPIFAYFFNGNKINIYGYSSILASRLMVTTSYSSSQPSFVTMSYNHRFGTFTWIGNKVWVVGRNDPNGKLKNNQ